MLRNVSADIWNGRIDHLENRFSFRYHQVVELFDRKKVISTGGTCAIIGFECDEGVRRNSGRIGAKMAPNAIRTELAKLPWTVSEGKKMVDAGNIVCSNDELESAQAELGREVAQLFSKSMTPIIFGGGHETAYGHYLGVRQYIGKEASLGIINIDAHFDLRSYKEQTSSGTMFRQILEQDENSHYFVLGIQRYGNTQELCDIADDLKVEYIYEEDIHEGNLKSVTDAVTDIIEKHDYVMLTLCMDVLNAAFAPGVSATSPFGLSPIIVRTIIRTVASHSKTLSFDISEVNPEVDENGRTVKLAAYFANEAIVELLKRK